MSLSVIAYFLYSQFFLTPPKLTTHFTTKTVIITGSNTGLGKDAARQITLLGASKVILAVRDLDKGNAARNDIIAATGCDPSVLEVWQLDLGSHASVIAFAERANKLPRLDVLLENAGIVAPRFQQVEGFESTVAVNVISTFLLALLLLPKLKETARRHNTRPVLTIVSSEVHFFTSFPERTAPHIFDVLNDPTTANMSDRYNVSKLLEVFVVREWARLRPALDYPVTINMLNPGFCHSELARDGGWGMWAMKQVLARKTEVGARTLVNAAGEQGAESHGMYLSNSRVERTAAVTLGDEGRRLGEKIWAELGARLEEIREGVTGNL